MSAVKQAMTAGGIVTALFTTQFFIASKMTRSVDGEQPIFHVGFPHVYTASEKNYVKKEKIAGETKKAA